MLNKLLQKINQSCQERDWQAVADIDKELKLSIDKSISEAVHNPEKAPELMAELQIIAEAYQKLTSLCEKERDRLLQKKHDLNVGHRVSQQYLAISNPVH